MIESCGGLLGPEATEGWRFLCILDSMSIFSSFSSSRSFRSRTSASRTRTRSSSDSVYPRGKALRLSLSLVRHSKPTLEHCEQVGRMPSHRIFLLRQRSQAWAIRLCELVPTLMTFMGRIPGIVAAGWVWRPFDCVVSRLADGRNVSRLAGQEVEEWSV